MLLQQHLKHQHQHQHKQLRDSLVTQHKVLSGYKYGYYYFIVYIYMKDI